MSKDVSRRTFLKKSTLAVTAPALAMSFEEEALLARGEASRSPKTEERRGHAGARPAAPRAGEGLPRGKIRNLQISRLICGGNLVSGFAHSRDLIYVSPLLRHYFTDDKVCETFELCEERGINSAILRVDSHILGLLDKYRNERGGKLQWIAQAKLPKNDFLGDIKKAIDNGAVAVYIHGGVADRLVAEGKVELLGKAVDAIKKQGVVAGLAGHALETTRACEQARLEPDFYMKTLNAKNYWSAGPQPRHDSVWAETPKETIAFMEKVAKPWIAYKVLGAGAIHPRDGFRYVFDNGADFACVGMFDFQVAEDVLIAKRTLAAIKSRRRPWRA